MMNNFILDFNTIGDHLFLRLSSEADIIFDEQTKKNCKNLNTLLSTV